MHVAAVDTARAITKAAEARKRAVWAMTEQARLDTRPYVPRVSGDLMSSADAESVPDKGLLVWGSFAVPYARRQYYEFPKKSKQRHPLATMEWFAVSKGANGLKWERTAKREYRKAMKG
jgi:hypothetical protein